MLIAGAMVGALVILMFLVWIVRGKQNSSGLEKSPLLHRVDTAAFRNLLSETDEEYLRASLSAKQYRKVRRTRLLAVQEYLLWIAADCAVLLAIIRANTVQSSKETEAMVYNAIRLRLVSLAFWALLWVEYPIPALEIRPFRILGNYEEFWRSAELYLRKQPPQQATSPVQG